MLLPDSDMVAIAHIGGLSTKSVGGFQRCERPHILAVRQRAVIRCLAKPDGVSTLQHTSSEVHGYEPAPKLKKVVIVGGGWAGVSHL